MTAAALTNDKSKGFLISFVLHALLLALGGTLFVRPIEYGVRQGSGGIEVSLTAAPAEAVSIEAPKPSRPENALALKQDVARETPLPPQQAKIEKPARTVSDSIEKGDGSSPVPGKDKTTFYSEGGAESQASPNYLKNPAPEYPAAARRSGWSGTVILKVTVDKSGRAVRVEKETGSGHDILDQSAIRTVRGWRFRPARMGGIPVKTSVRVPIRFQLDRS